MSDQPPTEKDPKETTTGDNELLVLARRYGVQRENGLPVGTGRGEDDSNPVIAVNHDACILCDRCVRACDDIQGNDVIGRSGKGYASRIAFDLNDPMGESTCVTCGECVAACPTGALVNKPIRNVPIRPRNELKSVDTVCPYCGVGCALTYHVDEERNAIAFAEGRDQPGSQGACASRAATAGTTPSPQRLTTPLIRARTATQGPAVGRRARRGQGPPQAGGLVDYDEVMPHFREAAGRRRSTSPQAPEGDPRRARPAAIAGFGSAKCSNEEAYLFQKLIRAGFGTNNVDHCTRLCHASSVAALFEGVGSGAVSTTYGDIVNADVAILAGTNTTANHPVASSFFKQARRRGTKLVVVDVRRERIADHADVFCQIKPAPTSRSTTA
jgi:formate dehydrogenase major subunit